VTQCVCVYLYSQFIDVSVLDGGWSERPEQMARAKRYRSTRSLSVCLSVC